MADSRDDPLSSNTAKLSISVVDDGESRAQVRELLLKEQRPRRDSVVSFTTISEDNDKSDIENGDENGEILLFSARQQKRRRSSAQSFSLNQSPPLASASNTIKPPAKREKIHKRKLKKTQPPELEIKIGEGKKLPFRELRDFVLTCFNVQLKKKPSWFKLENPANITKVVFCLVPGLNFELPTNTVAQLHRLENIPKIPELDFFHDTFTEALCISNPGSKDSIYSPMQTITSVSLTKNEKAELLNKSKQSKIIIEDLLLRDVDMIQYNYPINVDVTKEEDWVETKPFTHEGSTIFALDCEFCEAKSGKVLTRVSVVNFQGEVVLDTYVKPKEEILDYLTKYSGITPELLENVDTDLSDVQKKLVEMISSTDILIGHSLESDLNVMKIKHGRIIDTSIIFQHVRGPPLKPSLKWLASTFLARSIQNGEQTGKGHSSIEDATACLDLVKLKIQEGKLFGLNIGEISIFEKLANSSSKSEFESLLIMYSQYKEQEKFQNPQSHHVKNIYVNNDDELVDDFIKSEEDKDFVVINLREIEFALKWCSVPKHYTGEVNEDIEFDIKELYKKTNERLKMIYSQLPENSLFIVHSTTGDPNEMYKLQNVRRNFQKISLEDINNLNEDEKWDINKQQKLLVAADKARESLAFISLKRE